MELYLWVLIYWACSFTLVIMSTSKEQLQMMTPGLWIGIFIGSFFVLPLAIIFIIGKIIGRH